jgi:hypothetical protein
VCWSQLQLFDWGKNRRNVDSFLAHFSARQQRDSLIADMTDKSLVDNLGGTPITRLFDPPDETE